MTRDKRGYKDRRIRVWMHDTEVVYKGGVRHAPIVHVELAHGDYYPKPGKGIKVKPTRHVRIVAEFDYSGEWLTRGYSAVGSIPEVAKVVDDETGKPMNVFPQWNALGTHSSEFIDGSLVRWVLHHLKLDVMLGEFRRAECTRRVGEYQVETLWVVEGGFVTTTEVDAKEVYGVGDALPSYGDTAPGIILGQRRV